MKDKQGREIPMRNAGGQFLAKGQEVWVRAVAVQSTAGDHVQVRLNIRNSSFTTEVREKDVRTSPPDVKDAKNEPVSGRWIHHREQNRG